MELWGTCELDRDPVARFIWMAQVFAELRDGFVLVFGKGQQDPDG